MLISVVGAIVAAGSEIYKKIMDEANPLAGQVVLGILVVFILAVIAGFFFKPKSKTQAIT